MPRYKLAPGTQVREEDFGLLFYSMAGPRLYFLGSGDLLSASFFKGELTLEQWLEACAGAEKAPATIQRMVRGLKPMIEKGVILEC